MNEALKRLPLLPARQGGSNLQGRHLEGVRRQAADLYYSEAISVLKVIYNALDVRFPLAKRKGKVLEDHTQRKEAAKKILNESRSNVFECVVPLYHVTMRGAQARTEADDHAQSVYLTVFDEMVSTLEAWLPTFVEFSDIDATKATLQNMAALKRGHLQQRLNNFSFKFLTVVAPKESD